MRRPVAVLLEFAFAARRSGCSHTRRRACEYSRKARNSPTSENLLEPAPIVDPFFHNINVKGSDLFFIMII